MAPKQRSIVISETINAPKATIFPMLLEADKLQRWFPTRAESDPVVGGNYMFSFEFLDPAKAVANHLRRGTFTEITPNDRVRYTWEVGNTDVEIVLVEKDGKTDVTLTHTGWAEGSEKDQEGHNKGWTFFLSNLKSLLEQGIDNRSPVMGMTAKEYKELA